MANIQVFEYQNNKVRTVDVDGEAWFVLKDVCAVHCHRQGSPEVYHR